MDAIGNFDSEEGLGAFFKRHRAWVEAAKQRDPDFFHRLSGEQNPRYFWIGCCDSRVPATEIVDLDPGEMFVHRNIANLAMATDPSFSAALQFEVQQLNVEHIMIVGHYGCGGIQSLLDERTYDAIGDWPGPARGMREDIDGSGLSRDELARHLCEQNVLEQVDNLARNPCVEEAWRRGHTLSLHGLIYAIEDGFLKSLMTLIARPRNSV